ncbi:hypothetical protein [Sneathiella glossodoripedis]|uniref:hypothetical protein n=1 Tax=Sneathiella glossodoripedis TaxID=418853 RepID=UPI0011DCE29B|nr:hypothetical protein [Sneathiella glossodoripedis]
MIAKKHLLVALTILGLIAAHALGSMQLVQQVIHIAQTTYNSIANNFEEAILGYLYDGRSILRASF